MYCIIDALSSLKINCLKDVSAYEISTYRGGGKLSFVTQPHTTSELKLIAKMLQDSGFNHSIIGAGSNTLIADIGYTGLTIHTPRLSNYDIKQNVLTVESGTKIPALSHLCRKSGLSGLENLSGIPASLGGAIAMNAGAYGSTIADLVVSITVMDMLTMDIYTISSKDIPWGYRTAGGAFKDKFIISATLKLSYGSEYDIAAGMAKCKAKRNASQPTLPSLGCAFKRIDNNSAGYFIERCGLKGHMVGGAMISPQHAAFIVNKSNGTASDYLELCEICKIAVQLKFGIELQREIIYLS